MKKLIAVPAAALALLVPAAAADAASYTIKTNSNQVTQLGRLYTNYTRNTGPTVGQAIRAFGTPTNTFAVNSGGSGCVVKWHRLGLRMEFWNYGGDARSDCHPDVGLGQSFTIERSHKWRTWKGLRIGMTEKRLWNIHPYSEWQYGEGGRSYWLREHWTPYGDESFAPILSAAIKTRAGKSRVERFSGWIGAAGE